jgi:uncharacterized protein (TIGR00661 family)
MKILYGVQGTGQGHISRARAMARALDRHRVDVTWLFSGRNREALFDMGPFGNFEHRRGLTFTTRGGRLRYLATVSDNNIIEFLRDRRELDLSIYDAVVTDFEPVSAWAARRAGVRCIGIGHQYAFADDTPRASHNWLGHQIMRRFAPANVTLGLHWHPYSGSILPPILDLPDLIPVKGAFILVYLPFEDQDGVTRLLQRFPGQQFVQYSAKISDSVCANVLRRRACIKHFKQHLATCSAVICNSGFELISECLQWGKPILTRPLAGQVEQLSNALALQQLGYATVTESLSEAVLARWLRGPTIAPRIRFPDVADTLACWLAAGAAASPASLAERLWQHSNPTAPSLPATLDTLRVCGP